VRGTTSELIGLFGAIVVIAGIGTVIFYGGKTAQVITAAGNVFTRSLRIATRQ
jgi:hypothetical protein